LKYKKPLISTWPDHEKHRRQLQLELRWAKCKKKMVPNDEEPSLNTESDLDSDIECTGWSGDISHVLSDSEDDEDWEDADSEDTEDSEEFESDEDSDEDFDLEELEGQDPVEGLRKCWEWELELQKLTQLTSYEVLLQKKTSKEWKTAKAYGDGLGAKDAQIQVKKVQFQTLYVS
jgi:hypothetical protein